MNNSETKKAAAGADIGTVITTSTEKPLSIFDFIARFDEAAKRRLDTMNKILRDLEMQMEVLETEMSWLDQSFKWS